MPRNSRLPILNLIRAGLGAAREQMAVARPVVDRAYMGGLTAHQGLTYGDIFTKGKHKWIGDTLHAISPGTWIDATGNKGLIANKNAYENAVGTVSDVLNPWAVRDEYHAAYDTAGRNADITDAAARVFNPIRNTVTGLMYFPTTSGPVAGTMLGLNGLNEAVQYGVEKYNLAGLPKQNPTKYMPTIPAEPDSRMSDLDREYNRRAAEHNTHVNDWVSQSDTGWKAAQARARELAAATAKIVSDGHKMGLSTAQIQAQIKRYKQKFGTTGADILRAGRSLKPGPLPASASTGIPPMARKVNPANAADALIRLGDNPILYDYNSWNRR